MSDPAELTREEWENPYVPLPRLALQAALAAYIGVPVEAIRTLDDEGRNTMNYAALERAIRAFVVTYNRGEIK